jgi:hypothetical protein
VKTAPRPYLVLVESLVLLTSEKLDSSSAGGALKVTAWLDP